MDTKIKSFLQSDLFILSIALFLGILCHYFVMTKVVFSHKNSNEPDKKYANTFFLGQHSLYPDHGLEFHKNNYDFKLLSLMETTLDISLREDEDFKYVDIVTRDYQSKYLKIDIRDNLINIKKEVEISKTIEKENGKIYTGLSTKFNQSLAIPHGVDYEQAQIIKPIAGENNRITIKFPKIKFTNS
ncbi:MAG: hypothetical protein K2Q18_18790 [Bdellovibrionales bacterium]|nr:hypothetical protein [Bdellovibrionales bacterium]